MRKTNLFTAFFRDRKGSSAVEFAVGAPVLLIGLIIVTDVGLAVKGRMSLDQSVRAGAEFAMNSVDDKARIENMVRTAGSGVYGTQQGDVSSGGVTANATKTCDCAGAAQNCAAMTLCPDGNPPSIFWQIAAQKSYDGIFMPTFTMHTEMKVQVR